MKYKFFKTADGSPSIDYFQSEQKSESMHNRVGAFTETLYIYHSAMQAVTDRKWPFHVLSVGLGIGYNEILSVAHAVKNSVISDTYIESYEIEEDLRTPFKNWLQGAHNESEADFYAAYEEILNLVSYQLELSASVVKEALSQLYKEQRLKLFEELGPHTGLEQDFSCILFDAYSSHTSPELWSEEFLDQFLKQAADDQCVLSTYAAKGTLKRSLLKNGFEVMMREGFGGKRQSTFAIKC